jgi:EAL domain-containing protein (putative c-di-GMP-specific phosphodiesterase class I)
VGIAISAGGYTNAEDVLRDADIAMYHAKSHHSGSLAMFDVAMHASAVASMGLQSDLRQAMDRKQFEVHYQPIVGLDAKEIDRFEALVRWRHPRRGIVAPMDFLPDLEEIGLIVALGRWVIEEVCRQIAVWQSSYHGLVSVSVNLSLREFSDARLVPHILGCLHRYGLVPANLTLEVTENVIMRNPETAQLFIEELHSVGIGVQIDDVGTSTSSLHALRSFPIQALKIDHSFIHDLDIDPRATMLVQFMIAMGQALGLDVVAEGVETMVQLQRLRAMGCNNAQGFLFAKAVDAGAAAQLLGQSLQVLAREPPLVAVMTSTDPAS